MHWRNAAVAFVLTCSAFTLIVVGILSLGLASKDGGKGESPAAGDRKSPGEDRKVPGEDRKSPGEDRKSPGEDRKEPGEGRKVPGEDRKVPGEGRKVPDEGGPPKDKDESLKTPKKKPSGIPPAKCGELRPVPGLRLQKLQGAWVLQEKLEFPDGMKHHTVVPDRDQTSICLRTEMVDVTDGGCTLLTDFYTKFLLTKNFTGYIKVKENMHWNLHMLKKDHDGIVIEADPTRYFVFIECVKSMKEGEDISIPGSVFLFTRGNLPDPDMDKIRANVESILRHDDETLLDFGAYCYDKKTPNNQTSNTH